MPSVRFVGVRLATGRGTSVGTGVSDDAFDSILDTELCISILHDMDGCVYNYGNLEED